MMWCNAGRPESYPVELSYAHATLRISVTGHGLAMEHTLGVCVSSKLKPRLVPALLWGMSGHRRLSQRHWRRIRSQVLDAAEGRCRYCGDAYATGMICDEVWHYDPDGQVARLMELQIICRACNDVIHLGQARSRLGPRATDAARDRMARVNGTSGSEAQEEINSSWMRWHRLGMVPRWTIEVEVSIRQAHPELEAVHGFVVEASDETD